MKILIPGGDGMLGHQLLKHFRNNHEVRVTLHNSADQYSQYGLFYTRNSYFNVDARDTERLSTIIKDFEPDAVINAIGVIKQSQCANDPVKNIEINALFPHQLARICKTYASRLLHFSTDCVFSGSKGMYSENDVPDAKDFYGKSKYLGEVTESHCITLRSSVIGLELSRKASLIEWFLSQRGRINGYTHAIYSGLTTFEMCRVIENILCNFPSLSGVWHVASEPVSKYEILASLAKKLNLTDPAITPESQFKCNRSLSGTAFSATTGYIPPQWDLMLEELAQRIVTRHEARQETPA